MSQTNRNTNLMGLENLISLRMDYHGILLVLIERVRYFLHNAI